MASEFAFRHVVGFEVNAALCQTCRVNAAAVRTRFPARPIIEVSEGDATMLALPSGDLVVFIYHAFGLELFQRLVERLMAAGASRSLFVIYQNPVFGDVLDRQSGMRRWFAETVACEADERGVGSGGSETVVSWVSRGHAAASWPGAEAALVVEQQSARLDDGSIPKPHQNTSASGLTLWHGSSRQVASPPRTSTRDGAERLWSML